MSDIVWLASYPKSGNTWLRVFLANLTSGQEEPVGINRLQTGGIASARELFDSYVGIEASELNEVEIERLRPRVYEKLAEDLGESSEDRFMKVHDAWTLTPEGRPLFSAKAGSRVCYIIRNPLDVAVSYAHFSARPVENVIQMMGNEKSALCRRADSLHIQLRQRLLTWSGHVRSWVDDSQLQVEVLRYEDMKRVPLETFGRVAGFLGLPDDRASVEKALDFSSFERLQRQEEEHGFRERGRGKTFFRSGQIGSWREELTADHVERIVEDHREVMARFGYLSDAGESGTT